MAKHDFLGATRSWLGSIGSAIAVSGAIASHHRPSDAQLRGAGIDPKSFDRIGRA